MSASDFGEEAEGISQKQEPSRTRNAKKTWAVPGRGGSSRRLGWRVRGAYDSADEGYAFQFQQVQFALATQNAAIASQGAV